MTESTSILTDLDRGLIHALQIDGRASFTDLADALGTSAQTVRRRYGRLQDDAGLRVAGLVDAGLVGRRQWLVRLTATAASASAVARALARRDDTSWVRLASGGTEIITVVTSTELQQPHTLLLRDVPRTTGITSVSAHCVLRTYVGGPAPWTGRTRSLTAKQERRLRRGVPARAGTSPISVRDTDRPLLDALARDGRASYAALATVCGMSASTVARRIDELRSSGALFFDLEIDDAALGVAATTVLWMAVPPARLKHVAVELSGHGELAFLAATTGATNLVAQALSSDLGSLLDYVTDRVGAIEGITSLETTPILQTLKAGAPLRRAAG